MIDKIILEKKYDNPIIIIGETTETLVKYCQEIEIKYQCFTSIPEMTLLANTSYIFIHRNYLDHTNNNLENKSIIDYFKLWFLNDEFYYNIVSELDTIYHEYNYLVIFIDTCRPSYYYY